MATVTIKLTLDTNVDKKLIVFLFGAALDSPKTKALYLGIYQLFHFWAYNGQIQVQDGQIQGQDVQESGPDVLATALEELDKAW